MISPQATTVIPPPDGASDGASDGATDAAADSEAPSDAPADAPAEGAADSVEVEADAAPPAEKIAIECGVEVNSEIGTSTVVVDDAPVIGPRSNWVGMATDASADEPADAPPEALAEAPAADAPGVGTLSHVPAKTVPDSGVATSTPDSASTIEVLPPVSNSAAPPAMVLPPCDWNCTNACGRPDGNDDGSAMLGSVGNGVPPPLVQAKIPNVIATRIPAPAIRGAVRIRRGVMAGPLALSCLVLW